MQGTEFNPSMYDQNDPNIKYNNNLYTFQNQISISSPYNNASYDVSDPNIAPKYEEKPKSSTNHISNNY